MSREYLISGALPLGGAPSDIWLRDGHIAQISPAGQLSAPSAEVVDATGLIAQDALVDAVNAFPGGIVFVSHDEYFVTSVRDVIVLEITGDGEPGAVSFDDDFDAYKRKALKTLKKWT